MSSAHLAAPWWAIAASIAASAFASPSTVMSGSATASRRSGNTASIVAGVSP